MSQKDLERRLNKIYKEARGDIGRKWYDYFDKAQKKIAGTETELAAARATGDKAEIARLEKKLADEKYSLTMGNKRYEDMLKETTAQLTAVNQTAAAYTNGQLPSFYREAFNEEIPEVAKLGINFTLADEATVRRRVMDNDIKLPRVSVNNTRDQRWNTKAINANITQGIIQGEPLPKIAKRLEPIMDRNKRSAILHARTLVNGAENQGRLDRAKELDERGVVMHKVWIATGDARTRDWHLDMDGQEVELDEPFVDGNGNELMFPGDPNAEPETVYNCRCTERHIVVGFRTEDGEIIEVGEADESLLHKMQIEEEKERRAEEDEEKKKKA